MLTYNYVAQRISRVLCSSSVEQMPYAKHYCNLLVSRYTRQEYMRAGRNCPFLYKIYFKQEELNEMIKQF